MKNTIRFEGFITALQPLATCSLGLKESAKFNPMYKSLLGNSTATPVPFTQTAKGARALIPGTGLRGALRRASRDLARATIIAKTGNATPWSLDQHYLMTLGGNKGKEKEDKSTVALDAYWREKNPLLSLYGAGFAGVLGFMEGRLGMGNAIAVDETLPELNAGARTNDLYRDKSQVAFLSEDDLALLISKSIGNGQKSEIKAKIKKLKVDIRTARKANNTDEVTALQSQIAVLDEEDKAVSEETEADDNSIGMPLAGFFSHPQGTAFKHTMMLKQSTEIELGFYLKSLETLALTNPVIGAHRAVGFGEIEAQWTVYVVDLLKGKVALGEIKLSPYMPLEIIGDALKEAIAAYESAVAAGAFDYSIPYVPQKA